MRLVLFIILIILLSSTVFALDMKKEINLSDMNIEEKIGQLVIAKPKTVDSKWLDLNLGGIFINHLNTCEDYKKHIEYYRNYSKIPLFIATDMEGYWNPFSFYKGKTFGEVKSKEDAYKLGKEQGKLLYELGFNLDFSPIVEIRNNVWPGRSFTGTEEEIAGKIQGYIKGLQSEEIMTTAKHYPGGNLVKNPHVFRFSVETDKRELNMFQVAFDSSVDFVMTGHPKVYGDLDSGGKQVTVSREVIGDLRNKFNGIIITDAVTMLGLRLSYFWNFKKVYPDLILAGNDMILDTHHSSGYKKIKKRINYLAKEAERNPELMKRIDESVRKVLEKKGYNVNR
jgi:beta-N-acetylhexosaminidase